MNIQYASAAEKDIPLLLDMMAQFYAIDGYHFDEAVSRDNISRFIVEENLGRIVDTQVPQLGLKALHLEVERHNEKGKKLYVKKGFKEHERALMTKRF